LKEDAMNGNGKAIEKEKKIENNGNGLACGIYLSFMGTMKEILNFGEFKFKKDTEEFKFFKKQIMLMFYTKFRELFRELKAKGLIVECGCHSDLKNGWNECSLCHGAGFKNTEELDKLLAHKKEKSV
jgi:hypothetical protein